MTAFVNSTLYNRFGGSSYIPGDAAIPRLPGACNFFEEGKVSDSPPPPPPAFSGLARHRSISPNFAIPNQTPWRRPCIKF